MIDPKHVHETLSRHQLADGLPLVMDLERSHGVWLQDAVSGEDFLDLFTCFASWPIGYNHPATLEPEFRARIELAGRNKPASSDLYTVMMAEFVEAFATRVTPPGFPHHFWVSGGSLAVMRAYFRLWLLADIQSSEIDFRFTPESGHSGIGRKTSGYDPKRTRAVLWARAEAPRRSMLAMMETEGKEHFAHPMF